MVHPLNLCVSSTSARQSDIRVCVHKELHVKHIPHFLRVENQDPFKQHHVSRVHCYPVLQPGPPTHKLNTFSTHKDTIYTQTNFHDWYVY